MRKSLLLFLLGCIVFAQTNDTSNEEALLNELLNSSPLEEADVQESTPETAAQSTGTPSSTAESSGYQAEAIEDTYTTQKVETPPQTDRRVQTSSPVSPGRVRQQTKNYGDSPELSEEARVQETPDIPNFSHKAHIEDVGAECVQCHQTLFAESVRGIKKGPSMKEICSQCHNGTDARSEVLAGFSDEKKYVKTTLPLFSHTKHNQHTEKCNACHTDIYKKVNQIQTPPPMDQCMGCHNDHRADSDCKVCHEHPEELKPKSHTARWVYRNGHGKKARLNQKECRDCHTEQQCTACHKGQTTFDIHRPGYKYSHGMDARQRTVDCGYCHDATISCAQCHERSR